MSASTARRSGRLGGSASGRDHWTLAFAIVMLLLFSLFLSLYSLSKRESAKLRDEIESLRQQLREHPVDAVAWGKGGKLVGHRRRL